MGIQNTMKALADPTRRTILNLLKKSRLSAGEIAEHFIDGMEPFKGFIQCLAARYLPDQADCLLHQVRT